MENKKKNKSFGGKIVLKCGSLSNLALTYEISLKCKIIKCYIHDNLSHTILKKKKKLSTKANVLSASVESGNLCLTTK